jgi:hypothetical protein
MNAKEKKRVWAIKFYQWMGYRVADELEAELAFDKFMNISIKEAKKEVFDDFDKHFKEWEDLGFEVYDKLKKKHLND